MVRRWVNYLVLLVIAICLLSPVVAHKFPIIEYTYIGHIWEEAYHTAPRQPVIDEQIVFELSVNHPGEIIEGNVTGVIAIYEDDTEFNWYGGKSYKTPVWQRVKEASLIPTGNHNEFTQDVVIGRVGSYKVFIDWYEDRKYIGQSMHTMDIENNKIGPMFVVFNILVIAGIALGVRRGIL